MYVLSVSPLIPGLKADASAHGFIAFSHFIFSEVPKWSLRSIFEAFRRPLGSLRGSFGATFAHWGPSWHPFGDHFGLLGRPVALSWLSWDDFWS